MPALTFSAFGHRWRVRRLHNEPLSATRRTESPVTGLYFESDTAASRFLPFETNLLPPDVDLEAFVPEQLQQFLGWAHELSFAE